MSKKRIIIALGHKDLGMNLPEQYQAVRKTAKMISEFVKKGYQIGIVFSNAPQVGMIHTAMMDLAAKYPDQYSRVPLSVCSAMSQGMIGYDLQNAIHTELLKHGIYKTCATVLTQVQVDPYDESFYDPVKVIGKRMSASEAKEEEAAGNQVVRCEDGTFRRIVPAPRPGGIVEIEAIKALLDSDQIVIACGGGGIPVVENPDGTLEGVAAVIDKDHAAELLAEQVEADVLLILTEVEQVAINWGKPDQESLSHMTLSEAAKLVEEGQFAPGSMLPKVEAAMAFVRHNPGKKAIITALHRAVDAMEGKTGTVITFA